ncbi:MAG: succinyl-diaminopimelate desuccinylase [Bordetella sp.]|nr:MAG: succinyl-diaminopimelate desuccinylase [Bordetella sp.]
MINKSLLNLLKNLIIRPSITPNDAGCQSMIASRLQLIGFDCENLSYAEVTNLWAYRGTGSPLIIFAGHTDVVPVGEESKWKSNPFYPLEDNGYIYGRGTSDMKGSIAAFIIAIEEFLEKNPKHKGSIAIMLTSDEEGPAVNGTSIICNELKNRKIQPDYCIIGEPTSEKILGDVCKNGRRGSLSGYLTVQGVQGHIAYSNSTSNPIHQLAPALYSLIKKKWDDGNQHFPSTTFQISNLISGTGAENVIPDNVKIKFNFRFSPESTIESLKTQVNEILKKSNIQYSLDWKINGKPFLTLPNTLTKALGKSIYKETNILTKLSTSGGTSDGRFITKICPQVVEFGPINESIHKIDESIKISDLELLKNIYKSTLENILLV